MAKRRRQVHLSYRGKPNRAYRRSGPWLRLRQRYAAMGPYRFSGIMIQRPTKVYYMDGI